jgi:hypothetical protein
LDFKDVDFIDKNIQQMLDTIAQTSGTSGMYGDLDIN